MGEWEGGRWMVCSRQAGRAMEASTCQCSQLSHFSSCLMFLVLRTPQLALLLVAQVATSVRVWPHP